MPAVSSWNVHDQPVRSRTTSPGATIGIIIGSLLCFALLFWLIINFCRAGRRRTHQSRRYHQHRPTCRHRHVTYRHRNIHRHRHSHHRHDYNTNLDHRRSSYSRRYSQQYLPSLVTSTSSSSPSTSTYTFTQSTRQNPPSQTVSTWSTCDTLSDKPSSCQFLDTSDYPSFPSKPFFSSSQEYSSSPQISTSLPSSLRTPSSYITQQDSSPQRPCVSFAQSHHHYYYYLPDSSLPSSHLSPGTSCGSNIGSLDEKTRYSLNSPSNRSTSPSSSP